MRIIALASTLGVLLANVPPSLQAQASSTVTLVPWDSTPYIRPFSACRDRPPDDAVAQRFFEARESGARSFEFFRNELESLGAKTLEGFSAAEAETYFLLLAAVSYELQIELSDADDARKAAVLAGRERGRPIAERFRSDSFVRCAWVSSELSLMNNSLLEDRFRDSERVAMRETFLAMLEGALAGDVRVERSRSSLHYAIGQYYLDKGFELLPRAERAAPLFETGARHLLESAATADDPRYVDNWTRYLFMLEKLPSRSQLEITRRLLEYVEVSWGRKPDMTGPELDVYAHILGVAGNVALSAGQEGEALSILERQVAARQQLRQRAPGDPNAEVGEALSYLALADTHLQLRNVAAAARAYDDAVRVFESAGGDAKEMLEFQEFSAQIAERRKSLPAATR